MWYQEDKNGFTWDELLKLYQIVDHREKAFRDDLFRFTNFYSAVCFAILGITLSGFVNLYSDGRGSIVLLLIIGPLMTLCMCFLGLRVTMRIYRRIMQEISIKAKLENALGLDQTLKLNKFLGEKVVWENDVCLLPPRHLDKRATNASCEEFIRTTTKGGFARDNRTYFGIIAFFAMVLAMAILVISII